MLDKLVRQAHSRAAHESVSENAGIEGLLDFVITIPDVMHDIHNGYMWSVRPFLPSNEALKNIWVSIAAVRSAYDLVMKYLDPWLA